MKCPKCNGKGDVMEEKHICDCPQCEGSGAVPCSAGNTRPAYPHNVERFIHKWQPTEEPRRKAFWKEFRKAANAYSEFKNQSDDGA